MRFVERLVARPAQAIASSFLVIIMIGTLLLSLPFMTVETGHASFINALFTATSAVCVTGLTVVDTGTYWSLPGQIVIALLIQVGGVGIMTLATLVAVVFFRRIGLGTRTAAQAETRTLALGDIRRIITRIIILSIAVEMVLAVLLISRFMWGYGMTWSDATYSGVFHAISAFNNAGFSLYSNSLMAFATDAWILVPIAFAVIIGGLGFPVLIELMRVWRRPRTWSVLTRITLILTLSLLIIGTVGLFITERGNAATWGIGSDGEQFIAAFFSGVMPRTAGFNMVDIGAMRGDSLALTSVLMFIGGGSAGTAGGIKVTTLGVLVFTVWAELRGRSDVEIGNRRVGTDVQRQSLAIVALGALSIIAGTIVLLVITNFTLEEVLFESISAFGTVGLSTGMTSSLPDGAKYALVILMFAGRIGPLTFASALARRGKTKLVRRPEERMSIG